MYLIIPASSFLKIRKENELMDSAQLLRKQILELTKEYYIQKFSKKSFIPGKDKINYGGRIFDEKDVIGSDSARFS